ncbi:hypothetical protein Hypma_011136 [Hypsizygus marmoreus]|uniref:Uncharacterized protein n=1 Tax=Hypsizygus marmoreus TaxID=39966 RepID=A0A369JL18_HYPMA|nr:hypothetical protein Hypma_011136 [Hypsizygus marmoreus]
MPSSTCSLTERVPPVPPYTSTPLDSTWNASNAVETSPSFASLPELSSTLIARSFMVIIISSQAQPGAPPFFSPTSYDRVEFGLPG